METVKMRKGEEIVNVRNTPEDIACAQSLGYVLAKQEETSQGQNTDPSQVTNLNAGTGNTGTGETSTQTTTTEQKTGLSAMEKKELLEFIGKRKLYDKSYKDLDPAAIIPLILEKARNKIVEAKLKTADEVAVLADNELFELFDTLK
jgi:hypothetical protein